MQNQAHEAHFFRTFTASVCLEVHIVEVSRRLRLRGHRGRHAVHAGVAKEMQRP
jgi:hypothetical protein